MDAPHAFKLIIIVSRASRGRKTCLFILKFQASDLVEEMKLETCGFFLDSRKHSCCCITVDYTVVQQFRPMKILTIKKTTVLTLLFWLDSSDWNVDIPDQWTILIFSSQNSPSVRTVQAEQFTQNGQKSAVSLSSEGYLKTQLEIRFTHLCNIRKSNVQIELRELFNFLGWMGCMWPVSSISEEKGPLFALFGLIKKMDDSAEASALICLKKYCNWDKKVTQNR